MQLASNGCNNSYPTVVLCEEQSAELELHTDTLVKSDGGTRIMSGLVIHPSRGGGGGSGPQGKRGYTGPPGPPGPQGEETWLANLHSYENQPGT